MNDIIEIYRETLGEQSGFLQEAPFENRLFTGLRFEVPPSVGVGWSEILQIDSGLFVGLCSYSLHREIKGLYSELRVPFQFNILLDGYFDVTLMRSRYQASVRSGDLWFCRGTDEEVLFLQPPAREMIGISLALPQSMVESWLGSVGCVLGKELELLTGRGSLACEHSGLCPLARSLQETSEIIRLARTLLQTERVTIYGKLRFESLSLDLLSRILLVDFCTSKRCSLRTRRNQVAVEDAIDILQQEWADPPTIAGLSRRVGINECYLKSAFRKQTGLSIGEYVRRERMNRALELIESGRYSILETALHVGYSNPSHFSAAFKRFYGQLPSYYSVRN